VSGPRPDADREGRAKAFLAGDADESAVQAREFLYECQANAGSLVGTCANMPDTVEALEHAGKIRLGDTDPGVGHAELHVIAAPAQGHADLACEGELERVREKIQDDLLPHVPIDVDRFRQRRALHRHRESRLLDGRAERARQIDRQRREIGRFVAGVDPPRFDS
jgi:hypothetical protein